MPALSPADFDRLLDAARRAQRRAYAPYSKFHVGAAILTDKGLIVPGCNVENASYGLCNCAERVAIGQLVVRRAGKPTHVVVVGDTDEPLTPCGACRQVLAEFNPAMKVYCVSKTGRMAEFTIKELLPGAFDNAALETGRKT